MEASDSNQSSEISSEKQEDYTAYAADCAKMLEQPRLSTCSVFVYTIDENSNLSFLLRCKKTGSKSIGMYTDFGTHVKESEPNILFSAARSFVSKTAGLFVQSEHQNLILPIEIKRIARESLNKAGLNLYTNPKIHEILDLIVKNQLSVFLDVLADSHLSIFIPLTYFKVEPINICFSEEMDGTRFQDVSFHWIPLNQISEPHFYKNYLSAFNFQVISNVAERIVQKIYNQRVHSEISLLQFHPQVAVLNCESQQHWKIMYETLMMGQFFGAFGEQEKWGFYQAYEYKLPSDQELQYLQAIIIPGSEDSVCDHQKTEWMKHLISFIQKVYNQHPKIKLLGICFGSQIIAQALGGKAEKMLTKMYIGKEVMHFTPACLKLPYLLDTIQEYTKGNQQFSELMLHNIKEQIILSCHSDHVTELPEFGEVLTFSKRCPIEHWIINKRVLCMQAHPEFCASIIQELIINKLYDQGLMDDVTKKESVLKIKMTNLMLSRHTMNKFIFNFLNQ